MERASMIPNSFARCTLCKRKVRNLVGLERAASDLVQWGQITTELKILGGDKLLHSRW